MEVLWIARQDLSCLYYLIFKSLYRFTLFHSLVNILQEIFFTPLD